MPVNFNFFLLCLLLENVYSKQTANNISRKVPYNIFEETDLPMDVGSDGKFRQLGQIKRDPKLKYILQWTSAEHVPFLFMGVGRQGFIERNCHHTNCYVTSFVPLLGDYTKFDAILFSCPNVRHYSYFMLPQRRLPTQKYVFVSAEPSENYPVFLEQFDGFFNWTWTYKLDSDLRWGFIVVTDHNRNVIGPKKIMHWIKRVDMLPVKPPLKKILFGKKKAVAWIASNCYTPSDRESQVKKLQEVLKFQHHLELDIYGDCGDYKCEGEDDDDCYELIRSDYHFYLAYEKSLSEDYVTEEILPALKYNAIPIVYGGANYSRFLPEGSYLDARELDVELLAAKINDLITNKLKYVEYFKWTNHYQYYSTLEHEATNEYCKMCAILNDEKKMKQTTVYKNFRRWWNPKKYHPIKEIPNETDPETKQILRSVIKSVPTYKVEPERKGFFDKVFHLKFNELRKDDFLYDMKTVYNYFRRLFKT